MSQHYERFVRFADIDAAGFVFFANYLAFCHEAYEASLRAIGIELKRFFIAHRVILPVGKAQAQYLGALQSGDKVRIELARTKLSDSMFRLDYRIVLCATPEKPEKLVGLAQTEHVAMNVETLQRTSLPAALDQWLAAKT